MGPDGESLVADDDFIIFKDRLNTAESSFLYDDLVREIRPDGMQAVKMGTFNRNKLLTWTMDWSFVDENGSRLPLSMESIDNLDPTVFGHLTDLVDKHTQKMLAQRQDPKGGAGSGKTSKAASGSAT